MEANICCAYNMSRGCRVSSKVTASDCGNEPFKLMKMMLDGLAKDPEGGFWLNRLSHSPQIVRLFPFDFVYLDSEFKIVQAVELPAEALLPRFHPSAASALILPINSLSSSGTVEGDRLVVCTEEELEHRIAESAPQPVLEEQLVPAYAAASVEIPKPRTSLISMPSPAPQRGPSSSVSIPAAGLGQGTGFTFALASGWQLSNSTTAGALLEEAEEVEATGKALLIDETDEIEDERVQASEAPGLEAEPLTPGALLLRPVPRAETAPLAITPNAIIEVEPEFVAAPDRTAAPEGELDDQLASLEAPERIERQNPAILDTDLAAALDEGMLEAFKEISGTGALDAATRETESARGPQQPLPEQQTANTELLPSAALAVPTDGKEEKRLADTDPDPEPERVLPRRVTVGQAAAFLEPNGTASVSKPESSQKTKSPGVAKATSNRGRKKSLGFLVKEFLNCPDPLPELRSHPRLVQQGMVAYDRSGSASNQMEVRDLSPTGLYLRAKKRWQPGKVVALTLQMKGVRQDEYQSFVDVRAKVVRSDEDGVGLSLIFPDGISFDPWKHLHTKRSDESDIQFFISEIRLATAEGFLQRICPTATDQIRHALHERLSNKRVASAVEIALKAEKSLEQSGSGRRVLAHSEAVMRVIENGSWIEDHWIRKMWAGLLVSSCDGDGNDRSNLPFLDLLARLTPIHLRIFSFACERAAEALAGGVTESELDLSSTSEELMEAADAHSLQRIQQTIGHLCNFGLFREAARPSYAAIDEKVRTRTTPTPLGLKMYARCNGHRLESLTPTA